MWGGWERYGSWPRADGMAASASVPVTLAVVRNASRQQQPEGEAEHETDEDAKRE